MVKCLISKNPNVGSFLLRLSLGLLFIYAGIGKVILGGAIGLSGLLWGQLWLAYFVGLVELLGGIMLLLGFMSRHASLLLIIVMLFAIFLAHNPFTESSQIVDALIRLVIVGGLSQILFSGSGSKAIQED